MSRSPLELPPESLASPGSWKEEPGEVLIFRRPSRNKDRPTVPTVAELEALLASDDQDEIIIGPDGKVHGAQPLTLKTDLGSKY